MTQRKRTVNPASNADTEPRPILLFDGVCLFCNHTVNFLIDRDRRGRLAFAPLQSSAGRELLYAHGFDDYPLSTAVLVEAGRAYTKSSAALRACRYLDGFWPVLFFLLVIPPAVRDTVYDIIAANRYRWFGQADSCRVPTPETRVRFLA